jgi:hypothetical protein
MPIHCKYRICCSVGGAKELCDLNCLDTSNKVPMDLSDWNFLREEPESKVGLVHQRKYLKFLNQCKDRKNVDSLFFVEQVQAG